MKNFYFTFGPVHYTKKGLPMRNKWVRVQAATADEALAIFKRDFMDTVMQKPNRWQSQHEESEFTQALQPQLTGGEFAVLKTNAAA